MAEFAELIRRGGEGALSFALLIEGVHEVFVSDASRSYLGAQPFAYAGQHASYEGLDGSNIATDEETDWLKAELRAGQIDLIVNDTDQEVATRVFTRDVTRRTFLGSSIDDNDTVIPAVSTEGWPSAGFIHIGRECIRYTSKTTNSFQGCTRGFASSIACAHNLSQSGLYDIGITDTPVALEERLARVVMWVDGEASNAGSTIWRGIVKAIRQTPTGFLVSLGHASLLLDQEFGPNLSPFGIRGFYFSSTDPATLLIEEKSDNTISTTAAFAFSLDLVGFYETAEEIRDAITNALNDSSYWTELASGSNSLPENADYTCVLYDGHLAIQYRTGTDAKWVQIVDYHPILFGAEPASGLLGSGGAGHRTYGETRNLATGLLERAIAADDTTYATWPTGAAPIANGYTRVSRVTTIGVETPEYPPNRVYYKGAVDAALVGGFYVGDTALRVSAVNESDRYFEIAQIERARPTAIVGGDVLSRHELTLYTTADRIVSCEPYSDFGTKRWDEVLFDLIALTPSSGTGGSTPWLPAQEFALSDIPAQTLAAGGAEFVKTFRVFKTTKLRDLFGPELQILGLSWATHYDGTLTVRRLEIAVPSVAHTQIDDSADNPYDRRIASSLSLDRQRDGIVNVAEVRFGYDARSDSYADVHISARVNDSIQHYGEHSISIEPIGEEIPGDPLLRALRDSIRAVALVAMHSKPYAHVTIELPGFHFLGVLVGDAVSLTCDRRVAWKGRRGLTKAPAQVTGVRRYYTGASAPGVGLTLRLADANVAGYAPCARVYHDTPLGVSNTRVRMRQENWDSDAPTTGTRYDHEHFQPGDVITIHQEDTTTAATQTVTITRLDDQYLYVDPAITLSMNDAGTIWVAKYASYDEATGQGRDGGPAQHDYVFIADQNRTLGAAGEQARVYSA